MIRVFWGFETTRPMDTLLSYPCVLLLAIFIGSTAGHEFAVTGRIDCNICPAEFPINISSPVPGAVAAVNCKDHAGKMLFYKEGRTNDNGLFTIFVEGEHVHEHCEVYAMSSSTSCNIPSDNNCGPVPFTHHSGIDSNEIKIRPFVFRSTVSLPICQVAISEYNAVGRRAGPAREINGAKRRLIRDNKEYYERKRDCCHDDYCSCHEDFCRACG